MAQAKMDFIINTKIDKTAFNELKKEIQALNSLTGQDLVKMGVSKDLKEAETQLSSIKASASQVEMALNKAFSVKLGTVNLSKFNNELKSMNLQKIANDFNKIGASGSAAFRSLAANVLTAKTQLTESHKVLEEMGKTMMNTIKWGISSSIWNTFTSSISKAYSYTKNLDKSLNNIRIVAKQSAEEMDNFAVKANRAAKDLGKTTLDYTNAALIYYQQGLSETEVEQRAATTLKMANVTGEAAQDVSDYMTAIWNNFKEGSQTVEYYADVLTALGAATASSTDEIAAGLEKFSAVADTVGLSYEYATAALATVTAETRQSADVVGTAFKTLFSRIQDLELGETLEDGTTLGKYSEALLAVGINIKESNGELKDMDVILEEMGSKWQTLSKDQQVALAQTVAGVRQYNQLIGLMANWDVFKQNLDIAKNATGELNEQQEIYLQSTQAHLNKLQASAERLYSNLIDTEGVNSLVDLFSGLVTGVSEYVEAIGGSKSILIQFGAIALKIFGKQLSQGIATTIFNIKTLGERAEQTNAQLALMQQFKGIKINDDAYNQLLKMIDGLNAYKTSLTEEQIQEANLFIQRRNELANDKEAWENARVKAEEYYQTVTGESVNLYSDYNSEQAQEYIAGLKEAISIYELEYGKAKEAIHRDLYEGKGIEQSDDYLQAAQRMLDSKILKNEKLEQQLKNSLNKMKKIKFYEDDPVLTDNELKIVKEFEESFGKAADSILNDTKKIKDTIVQSANGAGKAFDNEIDQADQAWDNMLSKFKTQYITQSFVDITNEVSMLASAIMSLANLDDIWSNENLSGGEKFLQTIMVISNSVNGLVNGFKLVKTTADLLSATVLANSATFKLDTEAQKKNTEAQKANKTETAYNMAAHDALNDEIQKDSESAHSKLQKELHETSQSLTVNTLLIEENTAAVRKQTAALIEQYDVIKGIKEEKSKLQMNPELIKNATDFERTSIFSENATTVQTAVQAVPEIGIDWRNSAEYQKIYKNQLKTLKGQRTKIQNSGLMLDLELPKLSDEELHKQAQQRADAKWLSNQSGALTNVKEEVESTEQLALNLEKVDDLLDGDKKTKSNKNNKKGLLGGAKEDFATIGQAISALPLKAKIAVAAIAAIGAAIAGAVYLIDSSTVSAEERLEHLQAAQASMSEELSDIKNRHLELQSAFSGYESLYETLMGCTKGTVEWNEAFKNLNMEVSSLLSQYPQLAKISNILVRDEYSGALTFDENLLSDFINQYEDNLIAMTVASSVLDARKQKTENEITSEDLVSNMTTGLNQARLQYGNTPQGTGITSEQVESAEQFHTATQAGYATNYDKVITNENILELADLTPEEYKEKLRQFADDVYETGEVSAEVAEYYKEQHNSTVDTWVENMLEYQDDINNLANSTQEAATQIENAAEIIANLKFGGEGESTESQLYEKKYTQKYEEEYDDWLEVSGVKNPGSNNISKTSSWENENYQKIVDAYAEATGKKYTYDKSNPVLGSDDNRRFSMLDENGKEVVFNAESMAETIAAYEAKKYADKQDYSVDANEIRQGVKDKIGENEDDLADKIIDEDFDVNTLTPEEYNKIKDFSQKDWESVISEDNAEKMGTTKKDFGSRIYNEIQSYDAEENALKLQQQWQNTLENTAKGLDVSKEGFEAYTQQLIDNSSELEENEMFAIDAAKAHYNLAENLQNLYEHLEDNTAMLRKWRDGAELTAEDAEVVGKILEDLSGVFGSEVSENFLKANLEDIIKLANGDISVLDDLQKRFAQDIVTNIKINDANLTDEFQTLKDTIGNLNLEDIEVGATLEDSALREQLQNLLNMAGITQEQANKILEGIGYDPEIEMKTFKVEGTQQSDGTYKYKDENGTEHTVSSEFYDSTTNSVTVPIINGKKTEYVGGNVNNFKWKPKPKSGSGGSKAKPKKEDKLEDEKDRYHDVDIQLKQISNSLEEVQKQTEKLTGSNLVENWAKQFKLLNNEIDTTKDKIKIAQGEQAELQQKLANQGVAFNADGTIANYLTLYDTKLAEVNAVIDKYNGMSAKQQEKYQDTLDKAKEDFNKLIEDIDRYDEVVTDLIPGLEADIQDAVNEQIQLKIEAFNLEITLKLETKDAELEWNEFKKVVLDDIDELDIFGNTKARLQDFHAYFKEMDNGLVQVTTKHVNDILGELKTMDTGGEGLIYKDDRASALDQLKEYYTTLMTNLTELHDLSDEIHDSYMKMMDEAQEKFDEQIEAYSTINDLIEHDKNVISMIYGEESYSALSQFYDRQEENNNKQLDFQKQQVEFWANQMTLVEEGSEDWDKAKENWMSAVSEWNSAVEAAIQNLQDKYLNAINEIFQKLNNEVTNGLGLDYVETQWDLVNRNAEEYLDSVNAIYNVQQLQSKYLDAIEQHDSASQQKKLNDLMEQEIGYLREQDKLSQYDIDRANLKYEIALKQIALEEAQQNKTQLRLRRDSQGNYTYQYTQDDDQVSSIQQEIADLYNQLYNLDAEEYRGNLEGLYDVWVEFQERMAEAAQINDPEQRAAKELLIKEQYGELINTLAEKNELIQSNLNQSTMSHLFDLYNQNIENYDMMTAEQQAILSQFMTEETDFTNAAFDNLFGLYNTTVENFQGMSNAQRDILMGSIVPQWETAVQAMADKIIGEGGFFPVCSEAFTKLDEATQEYEDGLVILQEVAGQSAENIKNGLDPVIEKTQQLVKDNNQLITTYTNELDAIKGIITELETLKTKYGEAASAAKIAAEEAKNYWIAATNKDAEADVSEITDQKWVDEQKNIEEPKPQPAAEPAKPTLEIGSFVDVKSGALWYSNSYGGGKSGRAKDGKIKYINSRGTHPYNIGGAGWIKKSDIVGYDTGGYTGDWGSDGRLAMLHQKELVLNASDTKNMLNAIEIVRDITSNLGATLMSRMAGISAANTYGGDSGVLEQNVHITAEFPNVENSHEIEDALNNLINKASQYIQK